MKGVRPFLKVVLLGDSSVGKTAILDRFVNKTFSAQFKATIGADFLVKDVEVEKKLITLQIWDTAGTERFSSIGNQYFRGADGCILVYDVTSMKSFEDVELWRNEFVQQAAIDDPLSFPFVVVGNKIDRDSVVPQRVVAEYCSNHGTMQHALTSAKDGRGVDGVFSQLTTAAIARSNKLKGELVPSTPAVDLSKRPQEPVESGCCS